MRLKVIAVLVLVLALSGLCQPPRSHAQNEAAPPGMIDLSGVPVSMVLPIYRELCAVQLIVSSEVKRLMTLVTIGPAGPLKKEEAMRLIEKSLLEQAGIVFTKLDEKHVSVTYNDALPTTPVKPHKVR